MGLWVVYPQNGRPWEASEGPSMPMVGTQDLFHTLSALNCHAICALNYTALFIVVFHIAYVCLQTVLLGFEAKRQTFGCTEASVCSAIPDTWVASGLCNCMTEGESLILSQPWFPTWKNASTIPPRREMPCRMKSHLGT